MNTGKILSISVLLLILTPFLVFAIPHYTPWFNSYIVTSGSMEPNIPTGSAIVVREVQAEQVENGEIITFSDSGGQQATTTHRVVDIRERDGDIEFKTKGDANEESDPSWVNEDDLVGRVDLTIPFLGKAIVAINTGYGYVLLILIPSLILIAQELRIMLQQK